MLTLYHHRTSVCAIKVRLVLREKDLPWEGRQLTLHGDQFAPEYLKLNPNGVVPTLVHDGKVFIESTVIVHYLDEAFPQPALMPDSLQERATVRLTEKLVDEYVHNSCTVLSYATANRVWLAGKSLDEIRTELARAPDRRRAAAKLDIAEHGMESPLVAEAVGHHEKLLRHIDTAVGDGRYIAGDRYSLADVAATPYVWRLERLKLARMWDKRPAVAAWYDRIMSRPSFQEAVTNWLTQEDEQRYGSNAPDPWPKVQAILEGA